MVNKVVILGRLGSDPDLKTLNSGGGVANLKVATSERWTDKDGEVKEKTEWHRIVVFGKLADICGRYISKGSQVYIEGRLQTRSWEGQDGNTKYTTEIVASEIKFLSSTKKNNQEDIPF